MDNKKKVFLTLARGSIAEAVGLGYRLDIDKILRENPWLKDMGASFVTLTTSSDMLRGCIGSIIPHQKLYEDIISNAKSAAIHDPRFPSLSQEEFEHIKVEVSILSKPRAIEYSSSEDLKSKVKPTIDGIVLKYGAHQATFLPQVWEQLPSFELFFSHLCQKAGMEADCLNRIPEISIYQVQEYREE